jgi:hypothetical protein
LPKADLGDKHLCEGCGAKFYDMKKKPPTCPACGLVHEVETKRKSRVAPAPATKKKPLVTKPKKEIGDEEIADDEDDATDLLPDVDEDDDDDLNDVGVTKPVDSDHES